jgi:serine/threonine protein kinase
MSSHEGYPQPDTESTESDAPSRAASELYVGSSARPDEYQLIEPLSRGGEGLVWRARYKAHLPRPVEFAVKQLVAPGGVDPATWPPAGLVDRWHEQLRLLHLVHHPHLAGYKELFSGLPPHTLASETPARGPESWYVVMEFVQGTNLHELVANGSLSLTERADVITEIADALDHLHSGIETNGMVLLHRDVKPSNVVVGARGAVLVDFGLMRVDEPAATELPAWTGPYLAPEVHADKTKTSQASDMWGLAGTAFFAVVGEHPSPFQPDLMRRQLAAAIGAEAQDPEGAVRAIMQVLDAPADRRPVDASGWARQLRACLVGDAGEQHDIPTTPRDGLATMPAGSGDVVPEPRRSRRRWLAALGAVVLLAAAGAAFIAWNGTQSSAHATRPQPISDDFWGDTVLHPTWTTRSRLLTDLATTATSDLPLKFEAPELNFAARSGMEMTGANGAYQFTGIASTQAFTPPLTVNATARAVVSHGDTFAIYLVKRSLNQWVSGALSQGRFLGLTFDSVNGPTGPAPPKCNVQPDLLYATPSVGVDYSVSLIVDRAGTANVTVRDSSGSVLAQRARHDIGRGPFVLVLAQREGLPEAIGPNVALWKKVTVKRSA